LYQIEIFTKDKRSYINAYGNEYEMKTALKADFITMPAKNNNFFLIPQHEIEFIFVQVSDPVNE
jgi:hypothetical protein